MALNILPHIECDMYLSSTPHPAALTALTPSCICTACTAPGPPVPGTLCSKSGGPRKGHWHGERWTDLGGTEQIQHHGFFFLLSTGRINKVQQCYILYAQANKRRNFATDYFQIPWHALHYKKNYSKTYYAISLNTMNLELHSIHTDTCYVYVCMYRK